MPDPVFTAITFSPVTEFIEKTRKLRDLYGSSYILSYLADSVCRQAEQELGDSAVVSPALLNITMGTPDQIVIQGDFPEEMARKAFFDAWANLMDACQAWVCENCSDWIQAAYDRWVKNKEWHGKASRTLPWDRDWQHWKNHAWEFFWVQAKSIPDVLDALADEEADRDWVGINWIGESSTLSGADAIAWPGLDRNIPAKQRSMSEADGEIRSFFEELNFKIGEAILGKRTDLSKDQYVKELAKKLGEPIIQEREQLSIPELTKRLFTLEAVIRSAIEHDQALKKLPDKESSQLSQVLEELPDSFRDVNLWVTDLPMGWFRGDGDQAGKHIRDITQDPAIAPDNLRKFSRQMREWGKELKRTFDQELGRVVIAGGDDFLGVFFPAEKPTDAIEWLCTFKEQVWHRGEHGKLDEKPITPSVGFVWASPQVPQRDILQHCDQAERKAKDSGRDRVCLRVLFASGTHLDWTCPWWLLPKVVHGYRDRLGKQDWTHFYKDVAALRARHAFRHNHQIALALFNLFFVDPETGASLLPDKAEDLFADDSPLWTQSSKSENFTGILHEDCKVMAFDKQQEAFNKWVISLAEVGFQLFN